MKYLFLLLSLSLFVFTSCNKSEKAQPTPPVSEENNTQNPIKTPEKLQETPIEKPKIPIKVKTPEEIRKENIENGFGDISDEKGNPIPLNPMSEEEKRKRFPDMY
ncbi:hypothetical protein KGV55_02665 [Candidatus Gracilibacteria bacterium]|nr:hypothetical protein [Candidatus Gracilibacteria bacterium]